MAPVVFPGRTQRPYGGWYDEVADALEEAGPLADVVVHRGEITFHVRRDELSTSPAGCATTRGCASSSAPA